MNKTPVIGGVYTDKNNLTFTKTSRSNNMLKYNSKLRTNEFL